MIALVSNIGAQGNGNVSVTTGTINTTGADLLIAFTSSSNGNFPTVVITDSKGNTWNPLSVSIAGSNGNRGQLFWSSPSSVGSGHTFTADTATGDKFFGLCVQAFSGAHASPYASEVGTALSSATSGQPGSITPPEDNCVIVAGIGTLDNSPSINSGFTITDDAPSRSGQNYGAALAYKVQTTAGAENPTWSWSIASESALRSAVFKSSTTGSALTLDLSDGLTLGETRGGVSAFARTTGPDALSLAEALATLAAFARSQADALSLGESTTRTAEYVRLITDATALAEALSIASAFVRSSSDAISIGETIDLQVVISREFGDALSLAEALSKIAAFARSFSDAVALNDVVSRQANFLRTVIDTIVLADGVSRLAQFVRASSDSLSLGENLSAHIGSAGSFCAAWARRPYNLGTGITA